MQVQRLAGASGQPGTSNGDASTSLRFDLDGPRTRQLLESLGVAEEEPDRVTLELVLHLRGARAATATAAGLLTAAGLTAGARRPPADHEVISVPSDPLAEALLDAVLPTPRPAGLTASATITLSGSPDAVARAERALATAEPNAGSPGEASDATPAPTRHGVRQLIRGGAAIMALASLAQGAGNLVFHAVASRLVGPADYGALGALLAAMLALAVPLTSVQVAVTRAVAGTEGRTDARELYARTIRWSALLALAVTACAPAIAAYLHVEQVGLAALVGPYVAVAVVGAVGRGVQAGRRKVGSVAASYAVAAGVRLLAGLFLVPSTGIGGALVATIIGEVAGAIVVVRRDRAHDATHHPRVRLVSRDLVGTVAAVGALWAFSASDLLVARHVLTDRASGMYVAASNAARVLLMIVQSVLVVALPRFVPGRGSSATPQIRSTFRAAMALTLVVTAGAAAALTALAEPILAILYGDEFGDATALMATLAASMVANAAVTLALYRELARRSRLVHLPWIGAAIQAGAIWLHHPSTETVAWIVLLVSVAQAVVMVTASLALDRSIQRSERRPARPAADPKRSELPDPAATTPAHQLPPHRILVLAWRDPWHPAAGGAERYLAEITRRWTAAGHEVTWFSPLVPGAAPDEHQHGVRHVRRGTRFTVYREARQWWKGQDPTAYDVILETVNTKPFGAIRWPGSVPVVGLIHQVAEEVWFYEAPLPVALVGRYVLEPRWLAQLRHMPTLTVSESSRRSLERHGINRIDIVPEGIDLPDPAADRPTAKALVPTIAFCGRLVRSKRPDDLIDAFRRLQLDRPEAELVVIGRGPLRDRLEAASPPGVRFADDLDDEGKLREMARAHLLVATSVREGWGLVVSEAATVGTPTLAYDVPGLRDSAGASGGYLCPPDPEALAAHMAALLDRWEHHPPVVDPQGGARSWDDVADAVLSRVAGHAGLDARAPAAPAALTVDRTDQPVETAS